ncbi:MAG: hypothetical protein QOJ13_2392 [Gaiellales bacterium]|jgi:hypothetical protein|nr:hypothetical protein [Gaiellales bacterium]
MKGPTDRRLVVLCAVAVLSTVIAIALAASSRSSSSPDRSTRAPAADPSELLPDLDQEVPSRVQVRAVTSAAGSSYTLGFRSAVRNVGDGPLIVTGSRPNLETPFMTVNQIINRAGTGPRTVPDVGVMRYTISPDHRHWHYLQFERYELQRYELHRVGDSKALVTDRKTGFCLGDRYRVKEPVVPAAAEQPVFTSRCGLGAPDRYHMREGISVGWGDDYSAFLEGQDLALAGIPDGLYVLVHRVNTPRHLEELSYANNAASVLLDLRWRDGKPYVSVRATCPDTERCDP